MRAGQRGQIALLLIFLLLAVSVTAVALVTIRLVEVDKRAVALAGMRTVGKAVMGADGGHGFLADMGRLPDPLHFTNPAALANELTLGLRADGSPALPVASVSAAGSWAGWRGPYLQGGPRGVAPGPALDPWGTSYRVIEDPTSHRIVVSSSGADRVAGNTDDLRLDVGPYTGTVDLQVQARSGGSLVSLSPTEVTVRLRSICDGSPCPPRDTTGLAVSGFYTYAGSTFRFEDRLLVRGTHAIEAFGKGAFAGRAGSAVIEITGGRAAVTLAIATPGGE